MANQPAKDGTVVMVRMRQAEKQRLQDAVALLNANRVGANYSQSSVIKAAIDKYITDVELLLK